MIWLQFRQLWHESISCAIDWWNPSSGVTGSTLGGLSIVHSGLGVEVTGNRAIDYCFLGWNWTVESTYMLQLYLQSYVTRRLVIWGGIDAWEHGIGWCDQRNPFRRYQWTIATTVAGNFGSLSRFWTAEAITVLELSLWKRKIKEQSNKGEATENALEREIHRARCGSSFVIPNVVARLRTGSSQITDHKIIDEWTASHHNWKEWRIKAETKWSKKRT